MKIAMTSPVGQRNSDQGWAVSFMMPASYTMVNIPVPDDPSVLIREIPAHHAAAIRYSGVWSEKAYKKQPSSLRDWMKSKKPGARRRACLGALQFALHTVVYAPELKYLYR